MDCFPMLYFLSVSEGILASTVEFSPAWYCSCIPHEFIYNSWNWPEMWCVASPVCLTNQRTTALGDLPFTYLNLKYNMPFDSPPLCVSCDTWPHLSFCLSILLFLCLLILSGLLWLKVQRMRKSFFVISICLGWWFLIDLRICSDFRGRE